MRAGDKWLLPKENEVSLPWPGVQIYISYEPTYEYIPKISTSLRNASLEADNITPNWCRLFLQQQGNLKKVVGEALRTCYLVKAGVKVSLDLVKAVRSWAGK